MADVVYEVLLKLGLDLCVPIESRNIAGIRRAVGAQQCGEGLRQTTKLVQGSNPDWAVLVATPEGDRLYFVVETKSSLFTGDLRDRETDKIECGKAHFAALAVMEHPAKYVVARNLADVI